MRGMTARVRSFQARTLSLEGEAACRRVRARRQNRKGFGRRRASRRLAASASREIGAPRGRRPIQEFGFEKARDRFPGAGLILNFRDDEDMPVICPTGQVFFGLAYAARMRATPANGWCRSASSANVEGSRAAPDRRDKKRAARRPAAAAQADLDSEARRIIVGKSTACRKYLCRRHNVLQTAADRPLGLI